MARSDIPACTLTSTLLHRAAKHGSPHDPLMMKLPHEKAWSPHETWIPSPAQRRDAPREAGREHAAAHGLCAVGEDGSCVAQHQALVLNHTSGRWGLCMGGATSSIHGRIPSSCRGCCGHGSWRPLGDGMHPVWRPLHWLSDQPSGGMQLTEAGNQASGKAVQGPHPSLLGLTVRA